MGSRETRDKDIAEALKKQNDTSHLKGETWPESQQVYQVRVANAFFEQICH